MKPSGGQEKAAEPLPARPARKSDCPATLCAGRQRHGFPEKGRALAITMDNRPTHSYYLQVRRRPSLR